MSLYHLSLKHISRTDGKNVIASAAYRSGEKLKDFLTGDVHDYSKRSGVNQTAILAPMDSPKWVNDREELWNKVEKSEMNKNGTLKKKARLAYEIEFALQTELSPEDNINMAKQFILEEFVSKGHVVDMAFHNLDGMHHNPHCHALITTREVNAEGFGKKIDRESLQKKDYIGKNLRPNWENVVNSKFAENNLEVKVSSQSYEKQGIDKIPQIHIGPKCHQMILKGKNTERFRQYIDIQKQNEKMDQINNDLMELNHTKQFIQPSKEKLLNQVNNENQIVQDNQKSVQDTSLVKNGYGNAFTTEAVPDKEPSFTERYLELKSKSSRFLEIAYGYDKSQQEITKQLERLPLLRAEIKYLNMKLDLLMKKFLKSKEDKSEITSLKKQIEGKEYSLNELHDKKPILEKECDELKWKSDEFRQKAKEVSKEIKLLKEKEFNQKTRKRNPKYNKTDYNK